jgi:hypothetical protein
MYKGCGKLSLSLVNIPFYRTLSRACVTSRNADEQYILASRSFLFYLPPMVLFDGRMFSLNPNGWSGIIWFFL